MAAQGDGGSGSSKTAARYEAVGESAAYLDFQDQVRRVAPVERPVLLMGERGTGKEMAAQRLHFMSGRWNEPFITLNCATLSPTLIESELFGHEKGSFTGAGGQRIGRFEAASGGTLFLDEISLIPVATQEKILRVVEYGVFERVGGSHPVEVDVRIIGASNVNLLEEARQGRFKRDLLDRLSFEVLFVPPLRVRQEDILLLAKHFANRMAMELGRDSLPEFSAEARQQMEQYDWPGNVRELKNVIERAVYRSESNLIDNLDFDPFQSPWDSAGFVGEVVVTESSVEGRSDRAEPVQLGDLPTVIRDLEIRHIRQAMLQTKFKQREAAELLGLTYHQFRGLYRKHREALEDVES